MSISSYNKIVNEAKRKFRRDTTLRLGGRNNNKDLSDENRSFAERSKIMDS